MKKDILLTKFSHFSPSFSCFATRYPLFTARELWWINKKRLEIRWGITVDHIWSQCMGRLVRYHRVMVTATLSLLATQLWGRRFWDTWAGPPGHSVGRGGELPWPTDIVVASRTTHRSFLARRGVVAQVYRRLMHGLPSQMRQSRTTARWICSGILRKQ
jgi:hypothetical protein